MFRFPIGGRPLTRGKRIAARPSAEWNFTSGFAIVDAGRR